MRPFLSLAPVGAPAFPDAGASINILNGIYYLHSITFFGNYLSSVFGSLFYQGIVFVVFSIMRMSTFSLIVYQVSSRLKKGWLNKGGNG